MAAQGIPIYLLRNGRSKLNHLAVGKKALQTSTLLGTFPFVIALDSRIYCGNQK